MTAKFSIYRHPGSGYIKAVCDVCRREYYRKDLQLVTDPFNFQKGLFVCKEDLDKINRQILPQRIYDSPVPRPDLIKAPGPISADAVETDDRAPSAPMNLILRPHPIDDVIDLYWEGPEDTGSSPILYYVVARATPQLGTETTINTDSNGTYYSDTTSDVTTEYSYRVAAVNSFGQSGYSDYAYWPTRMVLWEDIEYIVDGDGNYILDGDGNYLRSNHPEAGVI